MRIGYLSYYNSSEIQHWSGSIYFIRRALEKYGAEIIPIDALGSQIDELYRIKSLFYKAIGKKHHRTRERSIMRRAALKALKKIEQSKPDVILSLGSLEISMLECNTPLTFWSDATFKQLINYYPEYTNLSKTTLREGEYLEQLSISKSKKMFFASHWAARGAVEFYNAPPGRVVVAPFGANLLNAPKDDDILNFIEKKSFETIELLFIGVAFERKGGRTAVNLAKRIKEKGHNVMLHIVGCKPKIKDKTDFVKIYGFLRKGESNDEKTLRQLFERSHIFVMPSYAECFGIVFCEANAFGLPVVAANHGGMTTVVKEGINGFLFDYNEYQQSIENIATNIIEMTENKAIYTKYALAAYEEYRNRLNWETSVSKVIEELRKL